MSDESKKENVIVFFLGVFVLGLFIMLSAFLVKTSFVVNLPTNEYGVEVSIQEKTTNIVSYFLTYPMQNTTLSSDANIGDTTINLVDATGCVVDDVVDIYNNERYFQGFIKNVAGNQLTIIPQIDTLFSTTNTLVRCGEWNMNVDGSVTDYDFYIQPPTDKNWRLESIGMVFIDDADWDTSLFGSRSELDDGFVVSFDGEIYKELFLIYNNGGFMLRGGEVQDTEKARAGFFGFSVDLEFNTKYGSLLILDGATNDKLVASIKDNLSSQEEIAFVVRGYTD